MHSDYAWACNLAGRALHFTSEEDAAFERFKEAWRTAKTDEDTKEALWGLALVAVEIDPGAAATFLDELESDYPHDLDIRFRLAAGRAVASEQLSSLADVWPQFQALLPSVQHSQDPLAASCFLAIGAAMSVMTGSYSRGRDLADHALAICNELRLDFGLGTCLAHRAAAEIGLRQFSRAQRTLRAFERTPICREDPFFRLEGLKLKARLLASQGALDEAIATQGDLPPGRRPDRPLGVFLSTISILYAAHGDAAQALATARTARGHGSSVEMRYGSLLAEAIATSANGDPTDFRKRATSAIVECGRAHYLDGLIFAYRVYPGLLGIIDDPEALSVLRQAVSVGHDHELARRAGIEIEPGQSGRSAWCPHKTRT